MKIAVLGAGQMGTAFGAPAIERGHEVRYWGPWWIDGPALEALAAGASHPDLETALPSPIQTTTTITEAVRDAELVALAVVSEGAEWVSKEAAATVPEGVPILVFTKGLVERDGEIVPAVVRVREIFGPSHPVVVVGGPVKAIDLIKRSPTQTVYGSEGWKHAQNLARAVETEYYLPNTTDDLLGLGLCAALKNCYAIVFGYLTGREARPNLLALAYGTSLGELSALVAAAGGHTETVAGAAGAGDLYVTCLSGRNGDFGRLLGEGNPPETAREKMNNATVEGLGTLGPALALASSVGLGRKELPLLHHLDDVLAGRVEPGDTSLAELLAE